MLEQLPLKDIHLPDPVSWWPPAVGWWLLPVAAVLGFLLARKAIQAVRRVLARWRLRRQALAELDRIERDLESGAGAGRALENLSVLLRRVAITVRPGPGVAGRSGSAWVDWLERTGPDGLDGEPLRRLVEAPYQPAPEIEPRPVFATARRWIRHVTSRPS